MCKELSQTYVALPIIQKINKWLINIGRIRQYRLKWAFMHEHPLSWFLHMWPLDVSSPFLHTPGTGSNHNWNIHYVLLFYIFYLIKTQQEFIKIITLQAENLQISCPNLPATIFSLMLFICVFHPHLLSQLAIIKDMLLLITITIYYYNTTLHQSPCFMLRRDLFTVSHSPLCLSIKHNENDVRVFFFSRCTTRLKMKCVQCKSKARLVSRARLPV